MKKIILGVLLAATIASVASALPWMVTAVKTNVKGWTISVPGAGSLVGTCIADKGDSLSGFYIQVLTSTYPNTGYYYCKADSVGKASKYYGWWYYDHLVGDTQLEIITFTTRIPPQEQ